MFGFIRDLFAMTRRGKEIALLNRLDDYAKAIGLLALFEEGLGEEAISAVQEGREIDDDAVGDMEWNAERQFFLVALIGEVCVREGIEEVKMAYAIPASVLHRTLGMPNDAIPDFIQACWGQIGIFKNAGYTPSSEKDASLRFAYASALAAAENFLAPGPDDKIVPAPGDVANFVAMGPRAADRPASA